MSGTNPFRRKATTDQSFSSTPSPFDHVPVSSNPESGIPPIDTDVTRPSKAKTVKTVRIISPHSAEEHDPIPDGFYSPSHRTLFSPPPDTVPSEFGEGESPEDPFAADSEGAGSGTEDEKTHLNTQTNTGESQHATQASVGMPANPFKQTLASQESPKLPGSGQLVAEQRPSGMNNAQIKPQYDVNDFKNLLMTGEKNLSKLSTTKSAPPVSFAQAQNGDNSSNTDTSSTSRQSIFERASSIRHDSPRTSRDSSISDDDEQPSAGVSKPKTTKPKPTTPIHRYGKPMQANGPQKASFDDPTPLFRQSSGAAPSSTGQNAPNQPDPPSDKNKALPTPPYSSTSTNSVSAEDNSHPESYMGSKEGESSSNTQKKPAPAPPPSRRTRPMSIGSMNSGRSVSISEEVAAEHIQIASSPPSRSLNAPAPPPPRRSNTFRGDSSSSVPTTASVASTSDQSAPRDQSPPPSQTARQPVVLARSPSTLASKGPTRTSPASGSPAMAPPPPPPRRRGSSQSSNHYTPSRLSGSYTMPTHERLRSDSGASSISQLPMTTLELNSEQKVEQKDVIADLAALQREVDELRGKMR